MTDFRRPPNGFKATFGGVKVNAQPNSLTPDKYNMAINVRAYQDDQTRTRPGYAQLFSIGTAVPTNIRAYTALQTDDLPRILARGSNDTIYLDTGASVGTMLGSGLSPGATMIPFRPNESPAPWMYIANGYDYQKFSSPPTVVKQKVGIAEPQSAPDAALGNVGLQTLIAATATWAAGGTAGTVTTSTTGRVNDTIQNVIRDPAANQNLYSCSITSTVAYQKLMPVIVASTLQVIQDVFSPIATALTIGGILYYAGSTGHCSIVLSNLAPNTDEESIYQANILSAVRRGALLQFSTGEVCYVWSVTAGPSGTVAIETSTTSAHSAIETVTFLPAISLQGAALPPGSSITAATASYQLTNGVGTVTATIPSNPFNVSGTTFQPDDYISFGINLDLNANLTEMKILIDVGDGSFLQNYYYYTVRQSDLAQALLLSSPNTQLAQVQEISQRKQIDEELLSIEQQASVLIPTTSGQMTPGQTQWTQIVIPLSAFTRVGNDQSKSLQNANKIQFLWFVTGTTNVLQGTVVVFGGFGPDVGDVGEPYRYIVRPRASMTGVVGNPSPETRYGISPRRSQTLISLPSAAYDSQIDTWDVFRFGGSVTSWRYIGQVASSSTFFIDTYDDSAAESGDELDFDNFEPWPSVDLPNTGTVTTVCGIIAVVSSTDTNITSYLPGTLVQIGGTNVYTLRQRPTPVAGGYLLQFLENAGYQSGGTYLIQEPFLANQQLPYMWGPDANGTIFACGDSFRPGNVYYSKNYAPDQCPDSYNSEVTAPTEPLIGGLIVDGLSYLGSTERWWAMYPQPDNPAQRYNIVQTPDIRGPVSPWGMCTDGRLRYWWAKDGIYSSEESLTDADLSTLFPREGIVGVDATYAGATIYHPDYSKCRQFRLTYSNGYIYAVYLSVGGLYCTLVYDTRKKAWVLDQYAVQISTFYHIEQQPASGPLIGSALNPVLIMGGANGSVNKQQDSANDSGTPISVTLATFEFDAGDLRAPKQWGDLFLDCVPAATATPFTASLYSASALVQSGLTVTTSPSRSRVPLNLNGIVISDFFGLVFTWTDDFTRQNTPSYLYSWQPSYIIQPAREIGWETFGTTFGLKGYMHIRAILVAWVSTAPITLTITTVDGQDPLPITIPSSGGVYNKAFFPLSPNKGLLFQSTASSAAPFQFFLDDWEIQVGPWGRTGEYTTTRKFAEAQEIAGVT